MGDDELSARARLRVGTTLKGKYQLDRVLGVGGMAVVYAATHRNRNRVAVKVLHRELAVDASLRARFIREGYVANTVEHRGTVRVLDDDVDEDGAVFLVMELLEGETLDARWERSGRALGAREVATLMRDLLDVLVTAHAKGIVHRDLKPENLFLTSDGTLKVLDFGIARLREASPSTTRTGYLMGTPAFMPPEQALGRVSEVDALSDVWAVGATSFALLSGRLVHEGQTAEEMMVYAATKPAQHVASVAPSVPPELAEIVDRALAFEKRGRWPSAQAMRDALSHLLELDAQRSSPSLGGQGDDEMTKIAAPPQMTLRPPAAPHGSGALATPALPVSTIAGVVSRSTARRFRSVYTLAVVGGFAAGLLVIGIVAMRVGSDRPSLATPLAPSASLPVVVTTAAPGTSVQEVAFDELPVAAGAPDAAAVTTRATTPAPMATATPIAAPSKPNCTPPYTFDAQGNRKWKRECLR